MVWDAKRKAPWWGLIGAIVFLFGFLSLYNDWEFWNAAWYVPAWYGYLLMLDAAIDLIGGQSFVRCRRGELVFMLAWSIPFWYLFEAYNLALRNWYYVFIVRDPWVQGILAFLSFATVFPACFFHAELVRALGWANWTCRPRRISAATQAVIALIGAASLLLPFVVPRYTFWLVWTSLFWIPDLLNYRAGAPSLLGDIETGRLARWGRLLVGGLLAGLVWEGLNYWARCKWVYTVPGFEDWKLFEMPILGFLGFPLLALEAFATYTLVHRLTRGAGHWGGTAQAHSKPTAVGLLALAVALAGSLACHFPMVAVNIRSERPLLTELDGIDSSRAGKLRAAGIATPERLHGAIARQGIEALGRRTGIPSVSLEAAGQHAALAIHKGMGTQAAGLLRRIGVRTVADLRAADAILLHRRLVSAGRPGERVPRLAEVKVWIRAAGSNGNPRR